MNGHYGMQMVKVAATFFLVGCMAMVLGALLAEGILWVVGI